MLTRKKLIHTTIFIFVLFIGTFFLAEISFRLFWQYLPDPIPSLTKRYVFDEEKDKTVPDIKSIHFRDPKFGFSVLPHKEFTHTTDEFEVNYYTSQILSTNLGYRTDSVKNDLQEFNSIFLGDSFTFGLGVNHEDTFFDLYRKDSGLKNIINASVSGIDIYDYFIKIKNYLDIFPLENIYLAIYMGNDLFPQFASIQKNKKTKEKRRYIKEIKRKFATYRLIKGLKKRRKAYRMFKTDDIDTFWNYTDPFKYLKLDAENTTAYKEYKEFLEKIISLCKERKTKLYVILIPDKLQVYEEEVKKLLKSPSDYNFAKPNKYTAKICKKNNVPFLDSTSYLKRVAQKQRPKRLYFDYDIHFNALGHKAMADYLNSSLKK